MARQLLTTEFMNTKIPIIATLFVAVLYLIPSCTNDVLPEPEIQAQCDTMMVTYDAVVKDIIDNSCAYSGCHSPGGIGVGNYNSYDGLLPVLDNGLLESRVVTQKDDPALGMPPNSSVYPESIKDDLTEEELLIIQCWLLAGYPKN